MDDSEYAALRKEIGRRYYGARLTSNRKDAKFLADVSYAIGFLHETVKKLKLAIATAKDDMDHGDESGVYSILKHALEPGEAEKILAAEADKLDWGTAPEPSADGSEPARSAES